MTRRAWAIGLLTAATSFVPALASAQETEPQAEPTPAPPPPPSSALPPPENPPPRPTPDDELTREDAAKEDEAAKERCAGGADRKVDDHVFIFPAYVSSAIVATYVGLRLRLGSADVGSLPTPAGPLDLHAVSVANGFDFGLGITDWLGVFVEGTLRTIVSTNLPGLVYEGATYDIGGQGGAILRLFRSERTGSQLSLRAGGGYSRGQVAFLLPIFQQPIASLNDLLQRDFGSVIKTPFSTYTYGGALAFAQSFGRLLGVQASVAVGGGSFTLEPFDRARRVRDDTTVNELTYAFGIAPSIDFSSVHFPLAVMPEYVLSRAASTVQFRGSGDFDTFHQVAIGAYYTGRQTLQLGVLWSTILGARPFTTNLGTSDTPSIQLGEIVLRYVW